MSPSNHGSRIYLAIHQEMVNNGVIAKCPCYAKNSSHQNMVQICNIHSNVHHSFSSNHCYVSGIFRHGTLKPSQWTTALGNSASVCVQSSHLDDTIIIGFVAVVTEWIHCHVNVVVTLTVIICIFQNWSMQQRTISAQCTIIDRRKHNGNIINNFINVRYISSFEAGCRIFTTDITWKFPTVISLPTYLVGLDSHYMIWCNETVSTASKILRYLR